jgi:hypothetical protein
LSWKTTEEVSELVLASTRRNHDCRRLPRQGLGGLRLAKHQLRVDVGGDEGPELSKRIAEPDDYEAAGIAPVQVADRHGWSLERTA